MTTTFEAGRALDALVAEQVMGWTPDGTHYRYYNDDAAFTATDGKRRRAPEYSTDIAAAMLVVERVQELHPGWRFCLLGGDVSFGCRKVRKAGVGTFVVNKNERHSFGWRASFFGDEDPTNNYGQRHGDEWGGTVAHAICLAALAALSRPTPEIPAVPSPEHHDV